jgi:hypothetical protein
MHHVATFSPQPCLDYHFSANSEAVSPDATIAIVFGLIGAIMSFVGVVIAYLTLRSMNIEKRTLPASSSFILVIRPTALPIFSDIVINAVSS